MFLKNYAKGNYPGDNINFLKLAKLLYTYCDLNYVKSECVLTDTQRKNWRQLYKNVQSLFPGWCYSLIFFFIVFCISQKLYKD